MTLKHFILLTSVFVTTLTFAQTKVTETYEVRFYPSFHDNLEIKLQSYSDRTYKLTLKQDFNVMVFDSICSNGICKYYLTSIDRYKKAMELQKPNFVMETYLSETEFTTYSSVFGNLNKNCSEKNDDNDDLILGTDGITIEFQYIKNGQTKKCEFWSPSAQSTIGHSMIELLEVLEGHPSGIIERTAENIKWYFEEIDWTFRVISTDPLYVKVTDLPFHCSTTTKSFVDSLPVTDVIYLDFTNYQGKDTSCFAVEFGKKFNRIRWIISTDDFEKFKELYGVKKQK